MLQFLPFLFLTQVLSLQDVFLQNMLNSVLYYLLYMLLKTIYSWISTAFKNFPSDLRQKNNCFPLIRGPRRAFVHIITSTMARSC